MNQTEIKRICIYGTGGVGGYFGAQMIYTLEKQKIKTPEIFFIARGQHLQMIQEDGLLLRTPQIDMVVHPSMASNDFESLETPDVVLICVKGYDLDDALEKISENINKKTIIIPLLNGVDIYRRIREKLDCGVILPSCVYVGTHIEKPGVVTQSGGD